MRFNITNKDNIDFRTSNHSGIPFAFSKAGWFFGTFLMITCGFLSALGLYLLSICAKKVQIPSSFHTVSEISSNSTYFSILIGEYIKYLCYNMTNINFLDIAVAVKCLGIATSYLIVIGDSLPLAMRQLDLFSILTSRFV